MIGIVVAVIVAAVVLVPICNSLTEGDGGSGGSGDDSQGYVKINDLHEYMAECDWTFPDNIKSFQIYDEDNISELPNISYDLEYMLALEQGFSHTGQDNITLCEYSYEYGEGEDRVAATINVDEDGVYLESTLINQSTNQSLDFRHTYMASLSSFLLTISDSGNDKVMTLQMEYTGSSAGTYSNSWVLNKATVISESEDGWIQILSNYENVPINVSEGCNVLWFWIVMKQFGPDSRVQLDSEVASVFHESDVSDGKWTVSGGSVYDEDNDDTYTDSSVWALESGENGVWQTSIIAESMTVFNTQNVDIIQLEGQGINDSVMNYVGTHGYASSSGGGDSSGGSDLGVAGTIIGIIPVFVILAILMGAVGLFYQNRKTI